MTEPTQNIAVYCGSAYGADPLYVKTAEAAGRKIVALGLGVVYGGGDTGLMGSVAKSAIRAGGRVNGVITRHLQAREGICVGLSRLEIVETMHERKQRMFDLSSAFVVLPGGTGTLDELVEILVWHQIKLHHKPIILVNVRNYWTPFLHYLAYLGEQGFADLEQIDCLQVIDNVDALGICLQGITS